MFCPTCGTEQLQGTTFCSNCGAELSNIKIVSPPPKSSNNIEESSIPDNFTNEQQGINLRKIPNDPFNRVVQNPNAQKVNNIQMQVMPNMGIPQPNQMQVMPNMDMPQPNQMPVMPNMVVSHPNRMQVMPNMVVPTPNQMPVMPNMGMPHPNQMPVMPNMGMPNQQININIVDKPTKKGKNKFLAAALAFFLGGLGAHKFYLGKYGLGILYILFPFFSLIFALAADSESIFMLCFLPIIVSWAEAAMYTFMSNEDFQKKY